MVPSCAFLDKRQHHSHRCQTTTALPYTWRAKNRTRRGKKLLTTSPWGTSSLGKIKNSTIHRNLRDCPTPSSHYEEIKQGPERADLVSSHSRQGVLSGVYLSPDQVRGKGIQLHMEDKCNQLLRETLYVPSTVLLSIPTRFHLILKQTQGI